jgi:Zn-dependent metalloprotease
MANPNLVYPLTACVHPVCFIAPPNILARIAEEGKVEDRLAAVRTLAASASMRTRRSIVSQVVRELGVDVRALTFMAPPPGETRTVYDVHNGGSSALPGEKIRGEGDPSSADESVNEAYDGCDSTYKFYQQVFDRDSVDGNGLELVSSVHYGVDYDNAFWNGTQMVYGDGSGRFFERGGLTKDIAVIAHELTHGITQFTAGLEYHDQPGALNESISDVFGSLVKQYGLSQSAAEADWLIGEGILGEALHGKALRSMKEPGTANKFDDQPANMDGYVELPNDTDPANDNGGVHINSGVPNHAFYLAATTIGGNAWEKPGRIWYKALTDHLKPDSDFRIAAEATVAVAGELFDAGGPEQTAVGEAWQQVGVL